MCDVSTIFRLQLWICTGLLLMTSPNEASGNRTANGRGRERRIRTISTEKRLVKSLTREYREVVGGPIGRPVINTSDTIAVEFKLGLIQMEVDEKNNMLVISAWARYVWIDVYLKWEPDDFDGIKIVKLPVDNIWIPDIMLYNTANTEEYVRDALAVIDHTGLVTWFPHRMFQSSCSFDVTNFPFDNQTCRMIFGSWTHTQTELHLMVPPGFDKALDLGTFQKDYKDSSKWDIMHVDTRNFTHQGFAVIVFEIQMRRKLMFSSYILTVPAVFLSFLTLVVFALPADDVEKCVLGLTIFGNLLLLLLILVEAAPPTASAVPLLGIYYCFTTVIVILSVFLSTFVVKLGNPDLHGRSSPIPTCIRKVMFDVVGRCLGMRTFKPRCDSYSGGTYDRSRDPDLGNHVNCPERYPLRAPHDSHDVDGLYENNLISHNTRQGSPFRANMESGQHDSLCLLREQLRTIQDALERMGCRHREQERRCIYEEDLHAEWKHLASIIDRFFLIVYLLAIIASLVFLFPRGYFD